MKFRIEVTLEISGFIENKFYQMKTYTMKNLPVPENLKWNSLVIDYSGFQSARSKLLHDIVKQFFTAEEFGVKL